MGYEVKLERFEGPLDLLLHLISRDEIDIYDIPIAHITRQYLEYIELLRMLDLEVAGEFLVMAASLMRIKAKMLLPVPPSLEEGEIDPRDELVQRLLEYRQFKEAAGTLKDREETRRLSYERGRVPGDEEAGPLPLAPATLFHLLDALNRVLARMPARAALELEGEAYDIEEKIARILSRVLVAGRLSFETLLSECRSRLEMIVTFLALLELMKLNRLVAVQAANFGAIELVPPGEDFASEAATPPSEAEGGPDGRA
ncbi:MAG: segregation/condensation protein A [Candidatus Eisenbacteria bacterium]